MEGPHTNGLSQEVVVILTVVSKFSQLKGLQNINFAINLKTLQNINFAIHVSDHKI